MKFMYAPNEQKKTHTQDHSNKRSEKNNRKWNTCTYCTLSSICNKQKCMGKWVSDWICCKTYKSNRLLCAVLLLSLFHESFDVSILFVCFFLFFNKQLKNQHQQLFFTDEKNIKYKNMSYPIVVLGFYNWDSDAEFMTTWIEIRTDVSVCVWMSALTAQPHTAHTLCNAHKRKLHFSCYDGEKKWNYIKFHEFYFLCCNVLYVQMSGCTTRVDSDQLSI